MRITQWGEYGVHCTHYIARQELEGKKSVSAADVAASQNIDLLYAQQILQRLRRNNIVQSIRGPNGGYRLSRPPQEISLFDILKASEGDTFEVICETKPISTERCAPGPSCSLRPIWFKLRDHIDQFLGSYSLLDILNQPDDQAEQHALMEQIVQIRI